MSKRPSGRQHGGRDTRRRLPFLPRRSVRLRLTAMYGVMFLVSGAVLLLISTGVAVSSISVATRSPGPVVLGPLAQAHDQIRALQQQLALANGQAQNKETSALVIGSLVALSVMTVAAVILGWLIAGRALRPVREMTAATRRISEENLHERLALPGPGDELKDLADTIDGLLGRLEGAFAAQRRFVANASHELRTPLATMRASLDVAVAKPEPVPAQTVALASRVRVELDRVDELLEGFLILARAQHRALPSRAPLDLDVLVGAALADRAGAIAARSLRVDYAAGSERALLVLGNRVLLGRMIENVLDNAIKHNQDGGWIGISTQLDSGQARLVVQTGGLLLDQAQVDQLAQPFRRLGADRIGSDNGSGLGLSIVGAIAAAHDGTLDLRARPEGGLRVSIEIPLLTPAIEMGLPA